MLRVHKTCSGRTKWLVEEPNYICPRCKGESWPTDGWTLTEVDVDGTLLDVADTFCYLGDMLCSSGDCDSAIAARYCVAWGKFRKLLPVQTTRHLSPRIRGKVYEAVLHGSETWGPKDQELKRLHLQLHYYWNLASRTINRSFAVVVSDGMAMYNGPCCVSNLSQILHFLVLETKEGSRRPSLNVWRLM